MNEIIGLLYTFLFLFILVIGSMLIMIVGALLLKLVMKITEKT